MYRHSVPLCRYEHGQKYSAHWDVNDSPKRLEQMAAKGVLGGLRTATLLMYLSGEMTSTTGGTMCVCVYVAEAGTLRCTAVVHTTACCLVCLSQCRPSASPRFPASGVVGCCSLHLRLTMQACPTLRLTPMQPPCFVFL